MRRPPIGMLFDRKNQFATVPVSLAITGSGNSIDLQRGSNPTVNLDGSSNTLRVFRGEVQATGSSNSLFVYAGATATITGTANTVAPSAIPTGTPVVRFINTGNTFSAPNGFAITSTPGDGQTYNVATAGTLVITDPGFTTLWTRTGILQLAGGEDSFELCYSG